MIMSKNYVQDMGGGGMGTDIATETETDTDTGIYTDTDTLRTIYVDNFNGQLAKIQAH
jgi:hypothetical protein